MQWAEADACPLPASDAGASIAGRGRARSPPGEPIHLVADRTGVTIVGDGEWAAAMHGGKGKRDRGTLQPGVGRCGVIVAQVRTEGHAANAAQVGELLGVLRATSRMSALPGPEPAGRDPVQGLRPTRRDEGSVRVESRAGGGAGERRGAEQGELDPAPFGQSPDPNGTQLQVP